MLGIAGSVMMVAGATAADVPPMTVAVAPVPPPAVAFDWAGAYGGVQASYVFDCGLCFAVAGQGGYNFVAGSFVLGVEGGVGVWWDGGFSPVWYTLAARAGYLVTDKILAYVELGIWDYFALSELTPTIGGGVEAAVTNSLSVFGEVKHWIGTTTTTIQGGINWHPGN